MQLDKFVDSSAKVPLQKSTTLDEMKQAIGRLISSSNSLCELKRHILNGDGAAGDVDVNKIPYEFPESIAGILQDVPYILNNLSKEIDETNKSIREILFQYRGD